MEGLGFARWAFVRLAFSHLSGNRMPSFTFLTLFSFLLVNVCSLAARLLAGVQERTSTQKKNPKKGLRLLGAAPAQRLE